MIRIPLLFISLLMLIGLALPARAQTPQREISRYVTEDREHLACINFFYMIGWPEIGPENCDYILYPVAPDEKKKKQKKK